MGESERGRPFPKNLYFKNPAKVLPQLFASIASAIGFLNTGFIRGWSSPGIPSLLESEVMELSTEDVSWISSLALVGAFSGSLLAGYPMDKLGRRRTLICVAPLFSLSWLLIGFATNKWMIFVGRVLSGFMSGIGNPASQIYIAECSSPRIRGALGSFTAVFLGGGILLGYAFGCFLPWNYEAMLIACFPILQAVCMYFAPYSPVWLLTKDRHSDAKIALQKFRGKDADVDEEYSRILENINRTKEGGKVTMKEMLAIGVVKPAILSLALMLFQQLSGFNAIIYYTVTIFKSTGSNIDRNISTVVIGMLLMCCTALSIPLVDRAGRRVLLIGSSILMCISLTSMGTYFYLKETADILTWDVAADLGWLPLVSLMVYTIAFSFGYNSVPFLIMGEILPVKFRNSLSALSSGFNLCMGFVMVKTFPYMVISIGGYGTFWFYAASCVLGAIFVAVCLPETKGKTIEEIESMFAGRKIDAVAVIQTKADEQQEKFLKKNGELEL